MAPGRSLLLGAEHQLRQPFNAISLLIGELSQGVSGRDRDAVIEDLRYALRLSSRWLDSLVELEKVGQGQIASQPHNLLLSDLLARLQDHYVQRFAELKLRFRVVRSRQIVRADGALLQRILTILLDNAAKFTPQGGVLLGCRRRGDAVRLEVWDSGPGIAVDMQEKVFEPFFRLENEVRPRERGLGLGLPLAQGLAALSGIDIGLTSRPGRGSCFHLTLPTAVPRPAPRAAEGGGSADYDVSTNPLEGTRVLVVDCEDADLLCQHFALWGAVIDRVPAGRAALADGLATGPALLVADQEAFVACGGWSVMAAAQRGQAADTALILLGEQSSESEPKATKGRLHLLARPVKPARLRALSLFAISTR